jgi:hypothetical protein
VALQADYREAVRGMIEDCAANASVNMQVYPARPMTLYPPTGFISEMSDDTSSFPGTSTLYQHTPRIEVTMVWGVLDSKEAVTQRDAWVDAFHAWTRERVHEAGARTLLGPLSVNDIPVFNPDWGNEAQRQTTYYATRIVLEGFATD